VKGTRSRVRDQSIRTAASNLYGLKIRCSGWPKGVLGFDAGRLAAQTSDAPASGAARTYGRGAAAGSEFSVGWWPSGLLQPALWHTQLQIADPGPAGGMVGKAGLSRRQDNEVRADHRSVPLLEQKWQGGPDESRRCC